MGAPNIEYPARVSGNASEWIAPAPAPAQGMRAIHNAPATMARSTMYHGDAQSTRPHGLHHYHPPAWARKEQP